MPEQTTTTTTVPVLFTTPDVITAPDGATFMSLDVPQAESSSGALQVLEVVVPPEANTLNLVWNMLMFDRLQQDTIDAGYMTIIITANLQSGGEVTALDAPIQIRLPVPPVGSVLAYSRDDITWTLIPQLLSPLLPEGQPDGYFIESDGTVTLFTRHLTSFGIRKPQSAIDLSVVKLDIVSGQVSRAVATGGTSEDMIRFKTLSLPGICTVTDSGLIYGVSAGICTVVASRGGGSIYLDTSSSTFSTKVISAIVPLIPPVERLPLMLQLAALVFLCVLLGFLGNRMWLTFLGYRSHNSQN